MIHRLAVAALLTLTLASASLRVGAADGDPDPGFSGDGKLVAEWAGSAHGARIALTSSGVLYVGATVQVAATGANFAVAKFSRDGLLMTSFGFFGYRTFDFGVAGGAI